MGRDREMRELLGRLRETSAGVDVPPSSRGAPGIGKTRLLEVACEVAEGEALRRAQGSPLRSELEEAAFEADR